MLADSMPQESSYEKFLGEIVCERIGTLEGATRPFIGVTTLESNGAVVSSVLIIVCDLVWYYCCTGEAKIGWDKLAGL
jgi:hypothetical protein